MIPSTISNMMTSPLWQPHGNRLIDFSGNQLNWVGLYAREGGIHFKVWNENMEVTLGGNIAGSPIGRMRICETIVLLCTEDQLSSWDLNDPKLALFEVVAEHGKFLVPTFECNSKNCQVICNGRVEILTIHPVSKVKTLYNYKVGPRCFAGASVYAASLHNFFSLWAYSNGGVFSLPIPMTGKKTSLKMLEPMLHKITALSLNEKCVVAATDESIHLWYYGSEITQSTGTGTRSGCIEPSAGVWKGVPPSCLDW